MLVQIDSREKNRVKSASEYYKSQGMDVEVCELEIGDYLFDKQVVFEMKTIADFIASINDHRVFNEAINQAENFDYHYVVIFGDDHTRAKCISMSRNYREVNYFQYLGAIASLNRYTTVIESYSPLINEAYYRMLITAKKCLQNKPIIKKFERKEKNAAFNYLAYCVYGVSAKRANDIVQTLGLKTLDDILHLDHDMLTGVDGIGDRLASKIMITIGRDRYE